jgi:transposase
VVFKEIYDRFWETIRPYFPLQKAKTGISRANLLNSFNGILYVLKTGITWRANRMIGIISNIPVNKRNETSHVIGRLTRFNKWGYAGKNMVELFFNWIKAFKKIYPRHERLEISHLGLVHLACSLIIWRV